MLGLKIGINLVIFALAIEAFPAQDADLGSAPENNAKYAYYYQFADRSLVAGGFQSPVDTIRVAVAQVAQSISLISWNLVSKQLPVPPEPYDRKKQFGDWIIDPRKGNCFNTRAVVLIRDSLSSVTTDPLNRCFVAKGNWFDPYTDSIFKSAADVQIDHVVPLKHVYISGGFQWDKNLKCLYTNYTGYRTHLLGVKGTENMKKSDATPFSYLPPNKGYTCAYLVNWLKIKKIWNLALIPPELQAIAQAFKAGNCDAKNFEMSLQELYQQRKYINDNHRLCEVR